MVDRKRPRVDSSSTSCRQPILDDGGGGGGGGEVGEDRLTALPDTLRLHILSLIPLKSAIRVSSLSSQWRGLWRYRWPQLSDIRLAPSPSSYSPADFVAFADAALLGRRLDCRLDALAISLPPGRRYNDELKRWLGRAAACGVANLSIELYAPVAPLPRVRRARRVENAASSSVAFQSICDCGELVRLAISGVRIQGPRSISVASLEILILHDTQIASSVLNRLVTFCYRLRSLELKRCRKLREISIVDTRHRLASLTIVDCQQVTAVSVRAPGLRRFRFSGNFLPSYRLDHVDGLNDVYMSAGCAAELPQGKFISRLGRFSDVKVLSLCNVSIQQIVISPTTASALRGVKRLTELQLIMRTMTESNLSDIYSFFRLLYCHGLEKLFIQLPTSMQDLFLQKYLPTAEEEAPQVDFANLKMIKVSNFKGHKTEMKLLELLLMNAGLLEILLVISPPEFRMGGRYQNVADGSSLLLQSFGLELTLFKKASQHAKVILKEYDDLKFLPIHSEV